MKLELENNLEALEVALDSLEAWIEEAGGSMKLCYAARLAMEELGTNIVKYGFDDAGRHLIRAEFEMGPPAFLSLEDDGHPFDPTHDAPEPDLDLDVDERPIGGLGLHMVRKMTASFEYHRVDERNVVTVTFPPG